MRSIKEVGSNPREVRSTLRKWLFKCGYSRGLVQDADQEVSELLAYSNFMSEDECMAFLNSVREAPFIPNINMMWTQQVINYLMLDDERCLKINLKFNARTIEGSLETFGNVSPLLTGYVKQHVEEKYWDLLPDGWTAKYFSPKQVLKFAVMCHNCNDFCKHLAERLFIKGADLEDSLVPFTKLPPPLPPLPKQKKAKSKKNEVILKDFPEGSRVIIDVPKPEQPIVPKVTEIPKVAEAPKATKVPKQRHNPVVAATPMFANREGKKRLTREQIEQLKATIKERYRGFGGTDSALQIASLAGVSDVTIYDYIQRICSEEGLKVNTHEVTPEFLESVKARLAVFGGTETQKALAKELGVSLSTVNHYAKRIRANMAEAT